MNDEYILLLIGYLSFFRAKKKRIMISMTREISSPCFVRTVIHRLSRVSRVAPSNESITKLVLEIIFFTRVHNCSFNRFLPVFFRSPKFIRSLFRPFFYFHSLQRGMVPSCWMFHLVGILWSVGPGIGKERV